MIQHLAIRIGDARRLLPLVDEDAQPDVVRSLEQNINMADHHRWGDHVAFQWLLPKDVVTELMQLADEHGIPYEIRTL